jgi:hypothetical protein
MVGASSYKGKKRKKKERIRQRIWEMKCCFLLLLSLAKGVVCVLFGMLLKDRFTIRKRRRRKQAEGRTKEKGSHKQNKHRQIKNKWLAESRSMELLPDMLCVSFGSDSSARLPSTPGADSRISPVCYYICLVLCVLYSAYCGRLHRTTTPRSTSFGFSVVVVVYVSASPPSLSLFLQQF